MLDGAHLLDCVRGGQRGDATRVNEVEAPQEAGDQTGSISITRTGGVGLTSRWCGGDLDGLLACRDARAMAAKRRDHHLRKLEQSLLVATGALLDELELIVVADHDPCATRAVSHVFGGHHRELVRGVKDESDLALAALVDETFHCFRIVGSNDHRVDRRRRVIQTEHGGAPHRPAVVTGELVVVQVRGGETGRAQLALEQAEPAAVDALAHQPVAVLDGVRACGGEDRGGVAEQRQVVRVVPGHTAPALLQVVDEKAQVQDVGLVEKDVVFEVTLEGEYVVVRD